MIYEKNSSSFPARPTSKRYTQIFEYMFVFVKGKPRNDIQLIADKRNKWAGWTNWGKHTLYDKDGNIKETTQNKPTPEFSLRTNIWKYSVSFNDKTGHPAVFPEKLAEDNILSWTVVGDTVLDPFMGSGTTAKMAMMNHRNYIGFEKNPEYYEVSLKRVGKYVGAENTSLSATTICDADGVESTLYVNTEGDSEEAGKTELWNKLIAELNQYFNEQTLGILKTLKFTFSSKTNDAKVQKVLEERGEASPLTKAFEHVAKEMGIDTPVILPSLECKDTNLPQEKIQYSDGVEPTLFDNLDDMDDIINECIFGESPKKKHRGRPKKENNSQEKNNVVNV